MLLCVSQQGRRSCYHISWWQVTKSCEGDCFVFGAVIKWREKTGKSTWSSHFNTRCVRWQKTSFNPRVTPESLLSFLARGLFCSGNPFLCADWVTAGKDLGRWNIRCARKTHVTKKRQKVMGGTAMKTLLGWLHVFTHFTTFNFGFLIWISYITTYHYH